MTTIRDVAREAGVSVATVSRVINSKGIVSPTTAERVREAVRRLAYVPHGGARSLTTRQTRIVGVVLPDTHGEFFSELIRGIDRVARTDGYHVLVSGSHSDLDETEAVLQALHGRVDGLILMMPGPGCGRLLGSVPRRCPTVLLNDAGRSHAHDSLRVDNRTGSRLAIDHLVERGHRRIALIGGPEDNLDALERREGYRQALAAHGIEPDRRLELDGAFTERSGFAAGTALARFDPRPTAVFAANDAMAVGCLAALRQAEVEVPAEVAVVGFDDIPIARYVKPALTTVRAPIAEVGSRAMARLLEVVRDHRPAGGLHEVVTPTLVIRESTRRQP
jgi:LacI family transcriptional regulator